MVRGYIPGTTIGGEGITVSRKTRLVPMLLAATATVTVGVTPAMAQLSTPPAPIETYDGDPGRLG